MNQSRLQAFLLICFLGATLFSAPPALARDRGEVLAIVGAKAYPTPSGDAIEDSAVLVVNGKIEGIGGRNKIRVPKNARVIDATGLTLVAGFWNCHVHFTGPGYRMLGDAVFRDVMSQYDIFLQARAAIVANVTSPPSNATAAGNQ